VTGSAAGSGRLLSRSGAWELTRAVSPRPVVRVADVDAYGAVVNTYTRRARTAGVRPDAPWAVHLTDQAGDFRLLAFDFDAAKGDPAADAAALCGWLTRAGLPHLLTRSGPSGGRHVWLGLADAVDAGTVDTLARLVRARLPSLDIAPLANPVTGCVRPPGAPHRAGGSSSVLAGDPAALSAPTVTAADVTRLVDTLGAGHQPEPLPPLDPLDPTVPLPTDRAGRLYLPGVRRQLPAGSAQALQVDAAAVDASTVDANPVEASTDASTVDASAVLRRVLVGAAAARWRCADVAALVAHSPGLEHLRSQGQGPGAARRLRSPGEGRAVLARQWDRAVRWVAAHPRASNCEDPTFEPRAAALAAQVDATQARADAAAGRWAGPGGPADRRVLDALCLLSLQAVSAVVEADIRRLGLICGIGRETARTALLRLARDGWITRHAPAEGPRAASWILNEGLSTVIDKPGRSQADPRPPGAGPAERNRWLTLLRLRLGAAAHDVFTPAGGLGHVTGQLYATLTSQPASTSQLAYRLGYSPTTRVSDSEHFEPHVWRDERRKGGLWFEPIGATRPRPGSGSPAGSLTGPGAMPWSVRRSPGGPTSSPGCTPPAAPLPVADPAWASWSSSTQPTPSRSGRRTPVAVTAAPTSPPPAGCWPPGPRTSPLGCTNPPSSGAGGRRRERAVLVDDPRSHVVWPRRVARHECRHPCSPAPALEQLPEHCRRPGVAGRRVGSEVAGEQQQPAQPRVLGRGRPSLSDRRRRCRSTTALPHPSRRRRVHPAQPVAVDGVQLRDSSAWGRCSTEGVRIVRGRPSPTSGSAALHPRDRRPSCGSLSLPSTTGTPKPCHRRPPRAAAPLPASQAGRQPDLPHRGADAAPATCT